MVEGPLSDWQPYVFPQGRRLDGWFASPVAPMARLRVPTIEAEEVGDGFVVTASVPGAVRDSLTIALEAGVLRISGEASLAAVLDPLSLEVDDACLHHFSREIRIDRQVDVDGTEARLLDGVLTVRLPYAVSATPDVSDVVLLKVS